MEKKYTPWRQFLAWVGFVSLFLWIGMFVTYIVWANHFINDNLPQQAQQ